MKAIRKEIAELFKLAEEKIKLIECLGEGITIAAINQLRYVASHLLRIEYLDNDELILEELRKAKNHCQRAIYDAVESGIARILLDIRKFQEDYRTQEIPSTIPSYIDICRKAEHAKKLVAANTRKSIEDHCSDPEDQYIEGSKILKDLLDVREILVIARNELNKKIKKRRINYFLSVTMIIIGIIGIIITLIQLIKTVALK